MADLSRAVKDTTRYVADAGEAFTHGLKVLAGSPSSQYHLHLREDRKGIASTRRIGPTRALAGKVKLETQWKHCERLNP